MENDNFIRLIFFVGIFVLMATWEAIAPFRKRKQTRFYRWSSNLSITALNIGVVKLLVPATAMTFAAETQSASLGILSAFSLPFWLQCLLAIVALDLFIYWQHVVFHKIPIFWRIHRMHHADVDFDVTTGARFHPIEITLSMMLKLLAILIIGAPPLAVLIFEILLNGSAMFNHSNISLPKKWDHYLRFLLVTPDMHRIHHSTIPKETDSNYGFSLSWWDRIFKTYTIAPKDNPKTMNIGLKEFRQHKENRLDQMLMQPFR